MDNADAPKSSYSLAFLTGLKSSEIIPALGEAFLISAIIAWSLLSRFSLKLPFGSLRSLS